MACRTDVLARLWTMPLKKLQLLQYVDDQPFLRGEAAHVYAERTKAPVKKPRRAKLKKYSCQVIKDNWNVYDPWQMVIAPSYEAAAHAHRNMSPDARLFFSEVIIAVRRFGTNFINDKPKFFMIKAVMVATKVSDPRAKKSKAK